MGEVLIFNIFINGRVIIFEFVELLDFLRIAIQIRIKIFDEIYKIVHLCEQLEFMFSGLDFLAQFDLVYFVGSERHSILGHVMLESAHRRWLILIRLLWQIVGVSSSSLGWCDLFDWNVFCLAVILRFIVKVICFSIPHRRHRVSVAKTTHFSVLYLCYFNCFVIQ